MQRAIAAIRTWLRENMPSLFKHTTMTDAEIINNYLIPARDFVQQWRKAETAPGGLAGLAGAFSRNKELAGLNDTMRHTAGSNLAKEAAKEFLNKPITNVETGFVAVVTRQSLEKMTSSSSWKNSVTPQAHYQAVGNVDALFRVATPSGERGGDRPEDKGFIKAMRFFDAPMPFNGEVLRVVITVKDFEKPDASGHRLYTVHAVDIEGTPADTAVSRASPGQDRTPTSDAGVNARFAQMVKIVKGEVKPDGSDDDTGPRFSRSATATGTAAPASPAATPLRDRMDKVVDSLIYNFQDRFKPLKDVQKRAGPVPEEQDASLAEERYSGTVRARTDDFEETHRTPLVKAIHDSKVAYEDVEDYLHALHAPSRNAAMREINPTEAELTDQTEALTAKREALAKDVDVKEYVKVRRELRVAEADIDDGLSDESLGRMLKQDIAKLKKMANVRDYLDTVEKLRALRIVKPFNGDNTALSGMSNAEADAIIAKAKRQGKEKALTGIASMIDTITTKTREIFVEAGLEKPETIAAWNAKYEHYVPLYRDQVAAPA